MELSNQQAAHLVAALRITQQYPASISEMEHFNGESFGPLILSEIDALCDDINQGRVGFVEAEPLAMVRLRERLARAISNQVKQGLASNAPSFWEKILKNGGL